jgi:methylenetetrahydrofolate dehydrogenase (NADP+)/methenyltetrahydrofolate cyclohydrolase
MGRSKIVGSPTALLLLQKNATLTICHSKTKDISLYLKAADIIVSAVGKPNLISAEMVKRGAVVIDAGTRVVDGKLTGDVKFKEVSEVASWITPVPGGVGSMTTTMLIENTVEAAECISKY